MQPPDCAIAALTLGSFVWPVVRNVECNRGAKRGAHDADAIPVDDPSQVGVGLRQVKHLREHEAHVSRLVEGVSGVRTAGCVGVGERELRRESYESGRGPGVEVRVIRVSAQPVQVHNDRELSGSGGRLYLMGGVGRA